MRAKLCCVVVALLLMGADRLSVSVGRVMLELPVELRWEMVYGIEGSRELKFGSLRVFKGGEITLDWEAAGKFDMVRLSGRPIFSESRDELQMEGRGIRLAGFGRQLVWGKATIAVDGNHLRVRIPSLLVSNPLQVRTLRNHWEPKAEGEFYLLFKQVK